ncbi:ComE operon protein 1 [Stieleria maiorica]|uniref:ComE operon protein 1 n=1 Tax=Stieleria maiorica TaxID=2795974 RepID=A0A5B9M8J6_9BACT|nr:helix-hairpin-helix domain-containing protein [Stieleria maiorica]QEF97013.1 ComE operon protein 1 [Stieleria maiorica]
MNAETDRSLPSLLHPAIQNATATLSLVAMVTIAGLAYWTGISGRPIDREAARAVQSTFQIDLNRAEKRELMLLPGVGERTAERILEDRERNGPFLSFHDLQRVPGIGPKTIQEISPHCRPVTDSGGPSGDRLVAER